MSDFLTTMTARAIGGIPVVEPLTHSMYLNLPVMPGDYTEDASPESELSTFIDDEPDLNFMPLVAPKGLSSATPRLNEDSLGAESQYVESELQQVADDVVLPNVDDGETIKDDNSLQSGLYNSNAEERKVEREETRRFLTTSNNSDVSEKDIGKETEIPPNIVPQVNSLNVASQSVEADVDFDVSTPITNSELQQVADDIEFANEDNTLESGLYNLNAEERKVERKGTQRFLTDVLNNSDVSEKDISRETEIPPNVVPQLNHLNVASQSVEADVELDLNISTPKSELKQVSDDVVLANVNHGEKIKEDNSNAEGRKVKREGAQRFLTTSNNSDASRKDITRETEIAPNIVPQVNRLEVASQSVEANIELDFNTSTPEPELYQNFNSTTHQPLDKQLTNTEDLPTQAAAEIEKLDISRVQNSSSENTRKQQTQKNDGVNKKNIVQKTVIPNLTTDSRLTNQVKSNLKETTVAPQVNRVETAKFSVEPDIKLNPTAVHLQSSLKQQRSIHQPEKTTTREIVQTQTEESTEGRSPSQFNNNSKSQTPISPQQQPVRANLPFNSNLVNDEHRHPEFVDKSEIQNSISRVKPHINKQKPVISPREDLVKNLPPINTETELRRHQPEPQPSPTIKVTIGRIEVRKSQPEPSPKAQARKPTRKSPALSLSDYLKQRDGK